MRIIEPKQLAQRKQKKGSKPRRWPLYMGLLLLSVGAAYVYNRQAYNKTRPSRSEVKPVAQEVATTVTVPQSKTLKTFTADEFLALANTIAYPNTRELTTPPPITGRTQTDEYIRTLAEKRGYRLRGQPPDLLVKTSDGFQLQPKALMAWEALQKAAATDGIRLEIISSFRSVNDQRDLFSEQLAIRDLTSDVIEFSDADQALASVLNRAAPPGYSRHHTGFTVDLACPDQPGVIFEESSCFTWLSNDNYKRAKENGWIPSYPPGAKSQGPEPEAWEYVWVGENFVTE